MLPQTFEVHRQKIQHLRTLDLVCVTFLIFKVVVVGLLLLLLAGAIGHAVLVMVAVCTGLDWLLLASH